MSHPAAASSNLVQPASGIDLPWVLVLPSDMVGQPLESWQALVQQNCPNWSSIAAGTPTVEWDWVNPELAAITVDMFRDLVAKLSFGVGQGSHRVIVILAADLAPTQAQNALLKSLEEPPARTTLILAVTHLTSLLPTVLSRCQIKYVANATAVAGTGAEIGAQTAPELAADIATLIQFSLNPTAISHSQLIQLASRYKDRVSAQHLLRQWLEELHQNSENLTLNQLKLAQATVVSLAQLDQNLSPALVLENLWFENLNPLKTP